MAQQPGLGEVVVWSRSLWTASVVEGGEGEQGGSDEGAARDVDSRRRVGEGKRPTNGRRAFGAGSAFEFRTSASRLGDGRTKKTRAG